jgi:hypothetical protein
MVGVFLNVWFDPLPDHRYFTSGMTGLGLGFVWYVFDHRSRLLFHFHTRYADPFERLEKYLGDKKHQWENTQLIRFGLMALLLLVMLTLLIFFKENKWTGIASALFIAFILATMIKGWLDFLDGILLQDIRHSLRDQTSE